MTRKVRRRADHGGPAQSHQVVEIDIAALDHDGNGVGRLAAQSLAGNGNGQWETGGDGDDGPPAGTVTRPALATVTVPFALPGEQVRARIWRSGGDGRATADLLDVILRSPERVEAPCPLFGRCGGCQVQHLAYGGQLAWKTAVVRDLAAPLGLADRVADCAASPRQLAYRSKLTPHHDRPRAGQPVAIGFLKMGRRHEVIDVERCPLATEAINAHLPGLRARIAASAPEHRRLGASFLIREASSGVTTDPDARVTERVGGLELEFHAREFFQNNPFLLPKLVGFVIDAAARRHASLLVDAYAGSGLFALTAASRFAEVVGVEVSPGAVGAARENAARNHITNARFVAADASRIFDELEGSGSRAAVVIDPPRKGCGDQFLAQLVAFAPATVVYVSCNPDTQMRDLVPLMNQGYEVTELQPFDMFPQTRHVECVAVLTRDTEAGPRRP